MIFIKRKYQEISFYLAVGLYAVFGSPTPDAFGWVEFILSGLLLYSIRMSDVRENITSFSVLFLGLSVPVVVSIVNGQMIADVIRDIIPFTFLFLPLFYGWVVRDNPTKFLLGLASVGLIFSARTIWVYQDVILNPILWGQGPPADLLYLANSPEVLFSGLYCLLNGGYVLFLQRKLWSGAGLIFLSFIPLFAMALMMQRAGMGLYFLNGAAGALGLLYFYPKRAVILFMIGGGGVFLLWPLLEIVGHGMSQKTELVGLNARAQEWAAVFHVLTKGWGSFLFGEGWGGRLENPAVGGLSVNYTHSLISSLLLKTGALGAGLVVIVAFMRAGHIFRVFAEWQHHKFLLLAAILSPFLVSTFLYASYKSLGFGLILLAFSSFLSRKLEKNPVSVS